LSAPNKGSTASGLALQIIDDLTDFNEDIHSENHSYLVSSIFHFCSKREKERLLEAISNNIIREDVVEKHYPESVRQVMSEAIQEALYDFSQLEDAGYWFNRGQAIQLIRNLIVLRGVKRLLPFFPEEPLPIQLFRLATA
jgi:hypothetical protein